MPVDNRSQIWTQVPHKLVRLLRKQHDVFYRSESEVVLNAWDFGKIHFEAINKRADQIFAIYSRVWKEQGNAISPDFRRAIYYKGIVPFLRQSSRAFHRHLTKIDWELHRRYADPLLVGSDFSREWAVARFSDEFDKFMVALRKRWDLKIEIALEQQRLEHSR